MIEIHDQYIIVSTTAIQIFLEGIYAEYVVQL